MLTGLVNELTLTQATLCKFWGNIVVKDSSRQLIHGLGTQEK